ncbi:baseplate wedge subunit [Vibrio phage D479]
MIFSLLDTVTYGGKQTADIFRNLNYYHKQVIGNFDTVTYQVVGDSRPEQTAYEIYGDPSLYWILLLINGDVDPYYDWLLPNETTIATSEYRYEDVGGADVVHHWVDEKGRWWYDVIEDPDKPLQWYNRYDFLNNAPEDGQLDKRQLLYVGVMTPVSRREHDFNVNERNRTIEILHPSDVSSYISSFLAIAGV